METCQTVVNIPLYGAETSIVGPEPQKQASRSQQSFDQFEPNLVTTGLFFNTVCMKPKAFAPRF